MGQIPRSIERISSYFCNQRTTVITMTLKKWSTDQEVHASSKHPDDEHDRHHFDDTNLSVSFDDVQQLQQLGRIEQVNQT